MAFDPTWDVASNSHGEGKNHIEWGLFELDPVYETAGQDVKDLDGLVERAELHINYLLSGSE